MNAAEEAWLNDDAANRLPDRFGGAVLIALALHAALLSVTFIPEKQRETPNTLDVTLAHFSSKEKPQDADFIAQTNQVGSGTEKDKRILTTDQMAAMDADAIHETLQTEQALRDPAEDSREDLVVTMRTSRAKASKAEQTRETRNAERADEDQLERRRAEIASLEAQLAQQKQAYAKRPKVRQLTSVSTRESFDALYVEAFRREVERIGTDTFPAQALQQHTFGEVRLMVSLAPNGHVREIEVLKSSGFKMLDEAAIRSVRLAAPFAPFPPEMRKITDILEIIRTWKFDERQSVSSQAG